MSLFKKQLPFILINIDITLNSSQLKQKLIDEMILLGTTLGGTQSESMFTVTKKDKNIFKNICQIFLYLLLGFLCSFKGGSFLEPLFLR